MKKTILIAALTMMSASAFASKARVNSLQSPAHRKDINDVLTKPDQAINYGDSMILEFGSTGSTGVTATSSGTGNAEGGFIRKMDNSAWGLYFGNKTVSAADYRTGYLGLENAVNLIYSMGMGDMDFGAGLYYSKSARKPDAGANSQLSQDAMGLYLSASSKMGWDAQFALGLANNAKVESVPAAPTTDKSLKGKTTFRLAGGYWMDTMYAYAFYGSGGAKAEVNGATTTDRADSSMGLGVINSHKKDGSEFYYGASYVMSSAKDDATGATSLGAGVAKIESAYIPLIAGLEVDANSWLTLRGSITQNFFIADYKASSTTAVTDKRDNANSTTVAAGAGLKFGKLSMDGVLSAGQSATGTFGSDGANFLAQSSFTYAF